MKYEDCVSGRSQLANVVPPIVSAGSGWAHADSQKRALRGGLHFKGCLSYKSHWRSQRLNPVLRSDTQAVEDGQVRACDTFEA